MSTPRVDEARRIVDDVLTPALAGLEVDGQPVAAVATVSPRTAAAGALAGVAVLVAPPQITFTGWSHPLTQAEYPVVVLAAATDPLVRWGRLDAVVDAIHASPLPVETGRPVSYLLPDGGEEIQAYELIHTTTP